MSRDDSRVGGDAFSTDSTIPIAKLSGPRKSPLSTDSTLPNSSTSGALSTEEANHPQHLEGLPDGSQCVDEQGNMQMDCDAVSVSTPSEPLHDKLGELEHLWSEQRSSARNGRGTPLVTGSNFSKSRHVSLPSHSNRSARPQPYNHTPKKERAIQIIGTPEQFSHVRASPHVRESQDEDTPAYERLYRKGKDKVASARLRSLEASHGSFRSIPNPPTPQSSVGGTTISTLSSTESVFDRLYKNEKRQTSAPRSSNLSVASMDSIRSRHIDETKSASAALERRLTYAPPTTHGKARPGSGKVVSSVNKATARDNRSDRLLSPRTPKAIDERTVSTLNSTDSVYERLYRREKRPASSLIDRAAQRKANARLPSSLISQRKPQPMTAPSRDPNQSKTPLKRGGQPKGHAETILEKSSSLTDKEHQNVKKTPPLTASCHGTDDFSEYDAMRGKNLTATFAEESSSASMKDLSPDDKERGCALSVTMARKRLHALKLAVSARIIQRMVRNYLVCTKGYEAKGMQPNFKSNHPSDQRDVETRQTQAALLLQSIWKSHRCRLSAIASLVKAFWLKCDFETSCINRILLLKIGLQCVTRAISVADRIGAETQLTSDKIRVEWSGDVIVRYKAARVPKMQSAVVTLKSAMNDCAFVRKIPSQRLAAMIVRATLEKALVRDRINLINTSALLIQSWARMVLVQSEFSSQLNGGGLFHRTDGFGYEPQYLSPTSLQRNAVIILQTAWRCHRSQVAVATKLLKSWWLKCDFRSAITNNRILIMKIGLYCLSKAIGVVDCWWITEDIQIHARTIHIKWEREVGVHFTVRGVPRLETCVVCLTCDAKRQSFVERWGHRKLAILIVKASLERVLRRDQASLWSTSAVLIQSWWRMRMARSFFRQNVTACKVIQRACRHCPRTSCISAPIQLADDGQIMTTESGQERQLVRLLLKTPRHSENSLLKDIAEGVEFNSNHQSLRDLSAMIIQYKWRKFRQIKSYTVKCCSGTMIQPSIRRHLVLSGNPRLSQGIKTLKALQPGQHTRLAIHTEARAAVRVQSEWRGSQARRSYSTVRMCALTIQSEYRRYDARRRYVAMRVAVVTVQSAWRGTGVRRVLCEQYDASVRVQSVWRGMQSRREVALARKACEYAHMTAEARNACTLQRAVRAWLERRHRAACMVQRSWRRFDLRGAFLILRCACVMIQSHERRRQAVLKFGVDTKCGWGSRRVSSESMRMSAASGTKASFSLRPPLSSKERLTLSTLDSVDPVKSAAISAHTWFVSLTGVRHDQELHAAAKLIQSTFFIWRMKLALLNVQSSNVLLERSVRGQLQRSATRFALRHINATFQSTVRVSFGRVLVDRNTDSFSILFAWAKAVDAAREAASVVIQSSVRRMLARTRHPTIVGPTLRRLVNSDAPVSVSRIESTSSALRVCADQSICAFSEYESLDLESYHIPLATSAITTLQAAYRRQTCMRRYAVCLQRMVSLQRRIRTVCNMRTAAICVQKGWRASHCRRLFLSLHDAIVILQACHRMRSAQRGQAAFRIQIIYRLRILRKAQLKAKAAIKVQAAFRGFLVKKAEFQRTDSIIVIQLAWRSFLQRRKPLRDATVRVQQSIRRTQNHTKREQMPDSLQSIVRENLPQAEKSLSHPLTIEYLHSGIVDDEVLVVEMEERIVYNIQELAKQNVSSLLAKGRMDNDVGGCISRLAQRVRVAEVQVYARTVPVCSHACRDDDHRPACAVIDMAELLTGGSRDDVDSLAVCSAREHLGPNGGNQYDELANVAAIHSESRTTLVETKGKSLFIAYPPPAGNGSDDEGMQSNKQELGSLQCTEIVDAIKDTTMHGIEPQITERDNISSKLSLAREAKRLVQEARDARTMQRKHLSSSRISMDKTKKSPPQAKKQLPVDTDLFGTSTDEELPSPIKARDDFWDWTNQWL